MDLFIEISVKSLFVASIGVVLCWLFRHQSASIRHWLISLTVLGLLVLPVAIGLGPNLPLIPQEVIPDLSISTNTKVVEAPTIEYVETPQPTALAESNTQLKEVNSLQSDILVSIHWLDALLGVWIAGVIFLFSKLLLGLLNIQRISQKARPHTFSFLSEDNEIAHIPVKVSAAISSPMTWGIFRPEILFPPTYIQMGEQELYTILKHEWTHIKRKDFLMHLLCLLSTCLYWFNPLVWVLKSKHLLEREKACDEHMIREGSLPTEYASQIISVARKLTRPAILQDHIPIQMARISQIKTRITALLKDNPSIPLPSSGMLANYGLLFACWIPLLAAVSPISPAKEIPVLKEAIQKVSDRETFFSSPEKPITILTNQGLAFHITQPTIQRIQTIEKLQKFEAVKPEPIALAVTPNLAKITGEGPAESGPKTGMSIKWTEGNHEYQLWTYGDIKSLSTNPM